MVIFSCSSELIKEARMLALTLRGEAGEGWTEENVRDYEYAIYQYFSKFDHNS